MNATTSKQEFKKQKCPKCGKIMKIFENVEEVSLFQQTTRIDKVCDNCGTGMTSKFSEQTMVCPECGGALDAGFSGDGGIFQLIFTCKACLEAVTDNTDELNSTEASE